MDDYWVIDNLLGPIGKKEFETFLNDLPEKERKAYQEKGFITLGEFRKTICKRAGIVYHQGPEDNVLGFVL